jgi:type I restriction enzyme, S subunit
MSNKAEANTMQDDGKSELKPKRRFPEFRDAPQWTDKPLGEIVSPIVRERKKPVEAYTGLGMRSHGKGTFLRNLENPEKNSMENLYEVQCDDLVVNITFAWEGAIAIAKPKDTGALVSHRFPTYVFKRDSAIPDFVRYIILDKQFIYKLGVISPGGAGRNRVLNKNDFLKLRVVLPEVSEQQRVAECLTSLDELIDAHGQKLDTLKSYKKALMQQLFPRDGETIPRLRFPEFKDAPEWASHKFGNLVVESFYGTSESTSDKGQYPVLRMGNMVDGGLDFTNLVYIDLDREKFDAIRLKKGDILLNRTNSPELVGKISLFEMESECITASYIVAFRLDTNEVHPSFCSLMLNTQLYQAKIKLLATPSISQANINPTTFRNSLDILIPTKSEQRRIASCISALGETIFAQAQKIEALKRHKKGLMQQLFPSPVEVDA